MSNRNPDTDQAAFGAARPLSVQDVFDRVCDLPKDKVSDLLDQLCQNQPDLRAEVESLLRAQADAGNFLGQPTADYVDTPSSTRAVNLGVGPGDIVDRYKLLQQIGEGGFGIVYMAQQLQPVTRRVAIKIIKLGMDTKQVVARFEAERQALAMMSHPNIARVLDGGATQSGRPYFVMELVRGDPITVYCDTHRLSTEERLRLFLQVCSAIKHAHQKGIIHRDIKPTNVLITVADDKPLAKVIDFGIAKATNSELTEKTLFTEFRQLIGTPEYMSPEQAERSGVDVDTRTDIYSLGVLLYEMLTGTTPFDSQRLRSAAWGSLQEIIRDEEPPAPSTRVSTLKDQLETVARDRKVEPRQLSAQLRGELDWIVMKAMEKDRTRRYSTVLELSQDIERYLADEPVAAGPPSAIYRWRKFAHRYRGWLSAAAVILFLLLAGIFATTSTMLWALKERDKAVAAEALAKKEEARARRFSSLAGNVLVAPDQMNRNKEDWYRDIVELQSRLPPDDGERIRQECQFATWLATQGIYQNDASYREEALPLLQEIYPRAKRVLGLADVNTFGVLNALLQMMVISEVKSPEMLPYYREIMTSLRGIYGQNHAVTYEVTLEYASILMKCGFPEEALEQFRHYLELNRERGEDQQYSLTHRLRLKMANKYIGESKYAEDLPVELQTILDIYDQHAAGDSEKLPDVF